MAEALTYEKGESLGIASDPRWLLVKRILATPDFQRSPRLSDFLRHICELTLAGRESTISEQYLGETLFGRPPGYDSTADTIVRSHALRLRRRLELYFQREGKSEPLTLVIPRGGYVPLFLPASETLPAAIVPPEESSPLPSHPHFGVGVPTLPPVPLPNVLPSAPADFKSFLNRYRAIFTLALCFVLGLIAVVAYQAYALHSLRTKEPQDRNHPLWGRLFNAEGPTRIVLGDSGLVLFHAATRRYVSLHDYVNNDLSSQMPFVQHADPAFAKFLASRRYTSLTDAVTEIRLLRLPEARPDRTLVSFSRDMHLDDFKNGNIIMIGAQEADPWAELFEHQMDFVFSIDNPDKHSVFLNRHPQAGEKAVYTPDPNGPDQVYAVIAFLPNLTASGNVLLLEGTTMAGTESAVDLVMDDQRLLPILDKIRRPDGTLPHFEMMIATSMVKDSPNPAQVVAIHVHR